MKFEESVGIVMLLYCWLFCITLLYKVTLFRVLALQD